MSQAEQKALRMSLIITILYAGLGTMVVFGLYPDYYFSNFFGEYIFLFFLITLPVSLIGFGIAYAEPHNTTLLVIVQSIIVLLFWGAVYGYFRKHYQEITQHRK
jgi:cell shape-determining protein MreD